MKLKTFHQQKGISSNILLLIFIFTLVFILPFIPFHDKFHTNSILFSIIFFLSILSLDKKRSIIIWIAIIAFITQWIGVIFMLDSLVYISFITNVFFFIIIVVRLIIQIAANKSVSASVILESINGYLLMGLMFTTLVTILQQYNPMSFGFAENSVKDFQEMIYYTYVTMSTLGYGDISPITPEAKSLGILISISGQLYIAVIIALLVGKVAGAKSHTEED
jgi:hypothetical protein